MKGNRVLIPTSMRQGTLDHLHEAHQGRNHNTTMCKMHCELTKVAGWYHWNYSDLWWVTKTKKREAQTLRTSDQGSASGGNLTNGSDGFRRQHSLVNSGTTEVVTKVLNDDFRKFALPEKNYLQQWPSLSRKQWSRRKGNFHHRKKNVEKAPMTVKNVLGTPEFDTHP